MQIQWTMLLVALALLLPPLPLSASTRRFLKSRRNSTANVGSLLSAWQNWADLIRAGIGVHLLVETAVLLNPEIKGASTKALLFEAAILGIVVLFQTLRIGQGLQFIAPVFYLCGLTLILAGYVVGGFAIFTGWLFAVGGKNLTYQLPVMGVALGVAGGLLDFNLRLAMACGLIFVPLLAGFMFGRPLTFVAREPTPTLS